MATYTILNSGPKITAEINVTAAANGYTVALTLNAVSGASYYGYYIDGTLYGTTQRIKENSPSQWSSGVYGATWYNVPEGSSISFSTNSSSVFNVVTPTYPAPSSYLLTCQISKQNADGTYGAYTTVKTQSLRPNESYSYLWREEGFEDVKFYTSGISSNQTIQEQAPRLAAETINVKYLKDENGDKFSPVTSSQSVYKPSNETVEDFLTNNKCKTYSTSSEIRVGTWVDGKPIYRKVLYYESIQFDSTWTEIQHGISNIDRVVRRNWLHYNTNTTGTYFNPMLDKDNQLINFYFASRTTLTFAVKDWVVGTTRTKNYIILDYTKTTDS